MNTKLLKSSKEFIKKNRILLLIVFLAISWQIFVFYRFPKQAWMEGLLEAWYTYKGLIFYKDFTTTYLPFLHMIMVPFHMIFGFTQEPTIILSPITSILGLIIIAVFSYRLLTGSKRFLPIIFFSFWDPILNENHFSTTGFQGLVNVAIFLFWMIWFQKPKKLYSFIIGFLSAVNFFSLQMVFPFLGVIFLSFLYRLYKKEIKLSQILFLVLGFLIPSLVVFGWFIYKGALYDLYYWNVLYYLNDYPYSNKFGRGFLNTLIFFAVFSPLISFVIPFYLMFKKNILKHLSLEKLRFEQIIFIYLSALSLLPTFWFAIFHPVRFQIGMPLAAVLLGVYFEIFWKEKRLLFSSLLIVGTIILLNIWVTFEYIIPKYKAMLNHPSKFIVLTKVYPEDPMHNTILWVRDNTFSRDKIFVLADPLFYLETDRLPAHPMATKNLPFLFLPLDKLRGELENNPPSYWIIDERSIGDRFIEYGYPDVSEFFIKAYGCDPVVYQYEYFTVRKHIVGSKLCF